MVLFYLGLITYKQNKKKCMGSVWHATFCLDITQCYFDEIGYVQLLYQHLLNVHQTEGLELHNDNSHNDIA